MNHFKSLTITITLLTLATSLTACGRGRVPGQPDMGVNPIVDTPQPPITNIPTGNIGVTPIYGDPTLPGSTPGYNPTPMGQPNPQLGSYKVDNSLLNDWQARGITANGGVLYIAAVDTSGLLKRGTILRMDASSGKNVKDLGSTLLGLGAKMDSTLQAVAVTGGNLIAVDPTKGVYTMNTNGSNFKHNKGMGGTDIAAGGASVFIVNAGAVERTDSNLAGRTPLNGLTVSSGIGTDSRGNLFAINGPRVMMVDMGGMPRDLSIQGLGAVLDIAADGRNGDVYVLEQSEIKRFAQSGQMMARYSHGAAQASSIAVDEMGNVYVADFGAKSKDSKIIKFGPAADTMNAISGGMGSGYGSSYGGGYTDPSMMGGTYGSSYGSSYGGGYGTGSTYGSSYGGGYGTGSTYGSSYGGGYGTGSTYGTGTYGSYAAPAGGCNPANPSMPCAGRTVTPGRSF